MPHNAIGPSITDQDRQNNPRRDSGPTPLVPKAFRIQPGTVPRPDTHHHEQRGHSANDQTVRGHAARALVDQLLKLPWQTPNVAYIHLPYCETRCLFAGFYKDQHTPAKTERYLAALLTEIKTESARSTIGKTPLQAIYLSNVTTTALSAQQLSRLLSTVRHCIPLTSDCKITIEERRHDLTEEKTAACLKESANRFALMVQTFDAGIRRSSGHIDSRADLISRLIRLNALCKPRVHQTSLITDLIYGFQ